MDAPGLAGEVLFHCQYRFGQDKKLQRMSQKTLLADTLLVKITLLSTAFVLIVTSYRYIGHT